MHYTGTLASNGKKFDSSVDRGQPFTFKIGVGAVIQGWYVEAACWVLLQLGWFVRLTVEFHRDEGVLTMSLGEKAVLHITSDYGYGDQGAGGVIPPNADLDFEVELLGIGDKKIGSESCCVIL